jgi:hypothetical protein
MAPESGNIVPGVFTPVLAKHSKSFLLIDCVSVGVDPYAAQLRTDGQASRDLAAERTHRCDRKGGHLPGFRGGKTGSTETPRPTVHDLYFEPKYEEFQPRTIWSLSNAFTSAFKELDPIPQFRATAKLGEFLESRFSQSF